MAATPRHAAGGRAGGMARRGEKGGSQDGGGEEPTSMQMLEMHAPRRDRWLSRCRSAHREVLVAQPSIYTSQHQIDFFFLVARTV